MTRYLVNWEVESDLILPEGVPFLRYDHPTSIYTVFLRNIPEARNGVTFLSMQFVFDAPSLFEAKPIGEKLTKEFLDYLSLVSNLKVRLRTLLQIYNWEPGTGMREALIFSRSEAHDDAPYSALDTALLETIGLLQQQSVVPRLRRALKWFATGIASPVPDDQFAYFWFVIEIVAELIKDPSPVPDRCPRCRDSLYCPTCKATPLHRPYPRQAIEQLFSRYVTDESELFYKRASTARNMLMHGDEVDAIESALEMEFPELVNAMGHLAWVSILNQFAPSLINKTPRFLSTSRYVYMNVSAKAHIQTAFVPNFANPDPARFPDFKFTLVPSPAPSSPPASPIVPTQ